MAAKATAGGGGSGDWMAAKATAGGGGSGDWADSGDDGRGDDRETPLRVR
ncbi:MAG: hypothetical protein V5A23_00095 [Halobacteriales archaeon]